jgi:hypothetical protein
VGAELNAELLKQLAARDEHTAMRPMPAKVKGAPAA